MKFTNKEQFLEHTNRHVENVTILSDVLLDFMMENKELRKEYNMTSKEDIESFRKKLSNVIIHHDYAKLEDSKEFLDKHGLQNPFYEFLFNNTGVELVGDDRTKIQKMNELDDLVTTLLLKKNGFSFKERNLYRFIEHTADIVERGCNPITKYEFGKDISRASEYKSQFDDVSPRDLYLIIKLENYYDKNLKDKQELFLETLKNINEENHFICKDKFTKKKSQKIF